jgi:hypothetical protein
MTTEEWLRWTLADAERRGLPALEPLLEQLARSIQTLREADFTGRADANPAPADDDH